LIFTCDNGVTAYSALDEAKKRGLKVIILDHHEFGRKSPRLPLADPSSDTLAYGDTPISAGYLAFLFSVRPAQRRRRLSFDPRGDVDPVGSHAAQKL
jgi:single-stranded DNA-specific DHH superfamily exonuclease